MALFCGPSNSISCLNYDVIIELVEKYNEYASLNGFAQIKTDKTYEKTNKTEYTDYLFMTYFRYIYIFYGCTSYKLLLSKPFFTNNKNIKNALMNAFKTLGPYNTTQWLNTINLDEYMEQLGRIEKFWHFGAVPYDFSSLSVYDNINKAKWKKILEKGYNVFTIIFNLDNHYESGSHWVCLYANFEKKQIYYFDSVGKKPKKRISEFIDILKVEQMKHHDLKDDSSLIVKYNDVQHQYGSTECGVYCIFVLTKLIRGMTFDLLNKFIHKDKFMIACRDKYFRPVETDEIKLYQE